MQTIPQWPSQGAWWEYGDEAEIGETFAPRRLDTPLDRLTRASGGRRSRTRTDSKRGRYIQARPSPGDPRDLAFDATLRAAAPQQKKRKQRERPGAGLAPRGLSTQGAREARRQPGALCRGCLLVYGGGRAHGGDKGRGLFVADGCLPAARPGGTGRLSEERCSHRAPADQQRRTGAPGAG